MADNSAISRVASVVAEKAKAVVSIDDKKVSNTFDILKACISSSYKDIMG
jgi:hypothetical protein